MGTDPRDRSFNMLKQSMDYDPSGEYLRTWLPELAGVPDAHVHHPWTYYAEHPEVQSAYPRTPIVMRSEWGRQLDRSRQPRREGRNNNKARGNRNERVFKPKT